MYHLFLDFTREAGTVCDEVGGIYYSSFIDAKMACNEEVNCGGVMDLRCDGKDLQLCKVGVFILPTDRESCTYVHSRNNKGNNQ